MPFCLYCQAEKKAISILFLLIRKSTGMLCFTVYTFKILTKWVSWSLIRARHCAWTVLVAFVTRFSPFFTVLEYLESWRLDRFAHLLTQRNCLSCVKLTFFSPNLCLCSVAEIKASVLLRSSSRPYADRTEVFHFRSHAANIPQRLEGRLVGSPSQRQWTVPLLLSCRETLLRPIYSFYSLLIQLSRRRKLPSSYPCFEFVLYDVLKFNYQ